MDDCVACERDARAEPVPRWKAPLLFVGVLLFCPCHLPATFAGIAALGAAAGGAAWFFGNQALVYATFSVVYLVFLVLFVRWLLNRRDQERRRESLHRLHAAEA